MKVLIIGPNFFSYTKAISKEINKRSVQCFTFNELHSNGVVTKIGYRLNLDFLFKDKINLHRAKVFRFIDDNQISDVLFISPEVVSDGFLLEVKKRSRVHLYMWDGFKNKKNTLSVLKYFNTKSSFDMFDCQHYGMNYIPLFAESEYCAKSVKIIYDMSFCGTIHSDRPSWIGMLLKYTKVEGLKIGLFLYYYSPLLLFIRLTLNKCCFNLFSKVSYDSFSKKDIANLFRESKVVVDLTHPNQNGLTSRTFEALRTGSKLATNNKNCKILEKEFPSRIFLLEKNNFQGKELLEFIHLDVEPLNEKQDRFLSIERFTDQLLESLND
mgnify:FL=1|jgi:hypothetical protein